MFLPHTDEPEIDFTSPRLEEDLRGRRAPQQVTGYSTLPGWMENRKAEIRAASSDRTLIVALERLSRRSASPAPIPRGPPSQELDVSSYF